MTPATECENTGDIPLIESEQQKDNQANAVKEGSSLQIKSSCTTQSHVKLSPIRSLYAEYVHVLVGPAKQDFGVHKGLLCKCSKFFQAALNGSFAEASKGVVELPEGNPKVFEIVHKWLYTHKLTVVKNGEDVKCYEDQLVDLFIFGDTFGIPTLCNSVIDAIVHNFEEDNIVITHSIRRVYNGTLEGSPLRKLIIATYINDPDDISNFLSKNSECFMACPQFLLDLAKAYEFKTKRTLQVLTKLRRIENVAQYYQSVDL